MNSGRFVRAGLLALTVLATAARAGTLIDPGDLGLRHDVQLLADHGVLRGPVSSWPIPRAALLTIDQSRLEGASPAVLAAWSRLEAALGDDTRVSYHARAAVVAADPQRFRGFAAEPREQQELELGVTWRGDGRLSGRLAGTVAGSAQDDRTFRLDNSYLAVSLGNWLLSAEAVDRYWGPGYDGSLILGNNARPVPSLAVRREIPSAFDLPVLRWAGPWDVQLSMGRKESDRPTANPWLFTARLAFRPAQDLEAALVRTAQWGGDGQPESLRSFGNMLIGRSNFGDTSDGPESDLANQFAGYEVRWTSPIGNRPYALYGQYIGIDERNFLPLKFIGLFGLETWGGAGSIGSYRMYLEYADTLVEFNRADPAEPRTSSPYFHPRYRGGYRYRGRVLGHAIDGDSRMVSLGGVLRHDNGDTWRGRAWFTRINRTARFGFGLEPQEAKGIGVDVAWARTLPRWDLALEVGGSLEHQDPVNADSSLDPRGFVNLRREF